MTAKTMIEAVGKQVLWKASVEMHVLVTVLNVKQSYGQVRLFIEPVHGVGCQWVNVESVLRTPDGLIRIQIPNKEN